MKINYHLLTILSATKLKRKQQKQTPTSIDQNSYSWKLATIMTKSNTWPVFSIIRSSQQWFCMSSDPIIMLPKQIQWVRLLQANSIQVLWYRKSKILIMPNVVQYSWQYSFPSKISSRSMKQNIECSCIYIQ